MRKLVLGLVLASASLAVPGRAVAAPADGAYGRIEGDLAVAGGLGASFGPRGPRGVVDLRGRYMQMAGVFATYEDGPLLGSPAEPVRVLATGIELRPLFFARWLRGAQLGSAVLDLAIDSFALELGAAFVEPNGRAFASKPGLQASLGLEVPLFGRATGLFVGVRGGARWSDQALGGGGAAGLGPSDRAGFLAVTLGWQQVFSGHVADRGDPRP